MSKLEQKLAELQLKLPELPAKEYPFAAGVVVDKLVFMSGQTPTVNGSPAYQGIVGSTVSVEDAQQAAVICTLNLLAALKRMIGDLDQVHRIVKLNGYVACTPDFGAQPQVINAASNLLNELFGSDMKHARAAVGVAALPNNVPVEIEMVVELKQSV